MRPAFDLVAEHQFTWHLNHMQELDPNDPTSLSDGRYQLLGILGEGSMGRTYLADSEAGKVAIKALYPSRLATAKDLQLFVREAEVLQKLSHPRIPTYIDAFDEGEGEAVRYHLVQQYVEGDTLRAVLTRGDRFDEASAGALMDQLLVVLEYMHGCDPTVVHRDLKPDNIILQAEDEAPTLVDFGAVREVVRLTMGGGSTIIGTYGYMPPEQLMGRALPASDIYSLGITVLELLTRQVPQDLHGQDVERLIAEAPLTEPFRRVLRRACAPNLTDRYQSVEQVRKDLHAALEGGALVHAGTIEAAIEKRLTDEERELKRSSAPAIVHLGYITLIGLIVLGAVTGTVLLVNMLATGFEGVFLASGVVSGAGLLITLILLGLRYTHDAWIPPNLDWRRVTGRITSLEDVHHLDANGNWSPDPVGLRVHYEFKTQGGDHAAYLQLPKDSSRERYPIGRAFDVYYQSQNPQWHEIQDFVHDPDDAMHRLFDPAVLHTPE